MISLTNIKLDTDTDNLALKIKIGGLVIDAINLHFSEPREDTYDNIINSVIADMDIYVKKEKQRIYDTERNIQLMLSNKLRELYIIDFYVSVTKTQSNIGNMVSLNNKIEIYINGNGNPQLVYETSVEDTEYLDIISNQVTSILATIESLIYNIDSHTIFISGIGKLFKCSYCDLFTTDPVVPCNCIVSPTDDDDDWYVFDGDEC